MKFSILGVAALLLAFGGAVIATGCGGGCDPEVACNNKTDKLIVGDTIIPICDAETQKESTRYWWQTDEGTCTCTLDTSIAGSFWRSCTFEDAP